ncbi:Uncharacterized protein OBRU01_16254 [Operophtera brumata]|uniref:Uncharacterized protein n=1 Tax=Operophtera brumata TaxID=104452 RepID=A0A0L7L3J2_OPEBR|nr:Uncharacterized protein OBRU01_16254 [Operophtera brumata]
MMYDPPDYPYKELSDTFDELLLTKSTCDVPDAAHETTINNVANPLSFNSNDSGRYFNADNTFLQENSSNIANLSLDEIQSDNLLNYEPTLLDENTVNQFLIPLQDTATSRKPRQWLAAHPLQLWPQASQLPLLVPQLWQQPPQPPPQLATPLLSGPLLRPLHKSMPPPPPGSAETLPQLENRGCCEGLRSVFPKGDRSSVGLSERSPGCSCLPGI